MWRKHAGARADTSDRPARQIDVAQQQKQQQKKQQKPEEFSPPSVYQPFIGSETS